jgi:5-formyltetrahydrofolate cyclo-ligase
MRKSALALRNAIPQNMRDAYSHLIRKKIIEYLDSISAKFVHTYIGFGSEVATHGIIKDLLQRNIKVAVPVMRGEKNSERMIHSLLENLDHLESGKFNVPEPTNIKEVSLDTLDAVIIPIVAFDGFGMRLGYGKGFYDRFLSVLDIKINRIGLAFSIQEMDKIPILSHDQLMNSLITENSHFFFK